MEVNNMHLSYRPKGQLEFIALRILIVLLLLLICRPAVAEERDLLVGIVRWAGWFPNNRYEKYLSDKQWRYRVPFYANIEGDKVTINEERQEVMDQEILYAAKAGIDYWTLNYRAWPRNPGPDFSWGRFRTHELHLASPYKNKINFCLMLQDNMLGPSRDRHQELAKIFDYQKEWDITADDLVEIFKNDAYQKVLGNRPLVYVFGAATFSYFETRKETKAGFELLAQKSQKAGMGKPYVVAMAWLGGVRGNWFDEVGYDAVSGYAAPRHPKTDPKTFSAQPYRMLAEANQIYWQACKETGRQVIPILNEGWDKRPHYAKLDKLFDWPGGEWFLRGSPEEVAQNVKAACEWVNRNPKSTEARSILIYAWNEFAEGGWLCPTREEGSKRLDAVGKVLLDCRAQNKAATPTPSVVLQ